MLQFGIQSAAFRYGLAEGVDPRQVPMGTLVTAENCIWQKSGRLEKRLGTLGLTQNLQGGGTLNSATRLFTRGSELCLTDGTSFYSYSGASATFRNVGKIPNVAQTWRTLLDSTAGVASSDVGLYSVNGTNLVIHAWTVGSPQSTNASNSLFYQVLDATTGAVVLPPVMLYGASTTTYGVRVLVLGTTVEIITRTGTTSPYNLVSFELDLSSLGTVQFYGPHTLRSDVAALQGVAPWDACIIGSTFVLAYNRTGSIVALESYTTGSGPGFAPVSAASGTVTEASGCQGVSIDGASGEVLYVAYVRGSSSPAPLRIAINNSSTLAAVVAASTVDTPAAGGFVTSTAVVRYDASNCILTWNTRDANVRANGVQVSSAGVIATTTQRTTYQAAITARPFMLGGACYQPMIVNATGVFSTLFTGWSSYLAEVETASIGALASVPHRYLGTIDPLTGGIAPQGCPLAQARALSSTQAIGAVTFQASAAQTSSNWRQGLRLVTFSIGASVPSDMWRSVNVAQETYIACSCLTSYDGRALFDYGFATAPVVGVVLTSGAGGLILAGTYLYAALQEYRSNAGVLYRSPTGTAAAITTSGTTSSSTVPIAALPIGNKQSLALGFGANAPIPSLVPVYRTVAAGTVYQRLCYEPGFNVTLSDASTSGTSLTDTRGDSNVGDGFTALAARPALYTTGGILDDYQPPSEVTMFHHVDRLFVLAGDQKTWWYSKAFQDDTGTAPGFHPLFRIIFDDVQTAGESLDDKAVFFSATAITVMQGLGPAPNGLNSDFTTPQKIQTDVGCINPRSVVSTPDGILFQSARGLYLLTRGLEVVWIGREVKDQLAAFPNITSAVLVSTNSTVRFTCNNAAANAGIVLAYNYAEKQWSTAKYTSGGAFGYYGTPFADACMWQGLWTFVSPTGQVYQESSATNLDAGAWVPVTLETAWISAAGSQSAAGGPMSFQSVREMAIHGTSNTDHNLTISVGFDSDPSYPQTATFLAQTPVTTPGVLDANIIIGTRRKCQTIRFKVTDATPTSGTVGTGAGPSFDMIALELGQKRGNPSNPATKRA